MNKNYEQLIKGGLLKRETINFKHIGKVLQKAAKSLKSARILHDAGEYEGAFEMAYEAMLSAGRALVFSYGLRPRTKGSHKTVVEFVRSVMGARFGLMIEKFDRMRRTRHDLVYEGEISVSKTEAKNAVTNASEFIKIISDEIKKNNPQKELF